MIKSFVLILLGVIAGAFVGSAHAGFSPNVIVAAGTVSATASISVNDTQFLADGTFRTPVDINLNGAHRTRWVTVSADGLTISVDGIAIASPPSVAVAWAAEQPVLGAKMAAMFANTSVQSFLTSP